MIYKETIESILEKFGISLDISVSRDVLIIAEKYHISFRGGLFNLSIDKTVKQYKHLLCLLSVIAEQEGLPTLNKYFNDSGNILPSLKYVSLLEKIENTKTHRFKQDVISEVLLMCDFTYPKSDVCRIYHLNNAQNASIQVFDVAVAF